MLSALGAKTQLLSSFHPQTAGQTERTSQEPAKTLRCLVEKSLPSWEASLPWGQRELTGRRRNRDAFQGSGPSLGANPFQGALPFTKKRELSPGLPPASPGSVASPHWTPRGARLRRSGFGDLNPTPFRSAGGDGGHRPSLPNGGGVPSCRILSPLVCLRSLPLNTVGWPFTNSSPAAGTTALCACRQCISVKDEDPWFMKRFNTSISPLLSQKNAMLSDDTFKWWQRLQTKQNANYSAVVQKLFQVVPGEGHYNDSGPNRCRTCAVVGNSGNLKGSDYGALIDSNDFIIRMNKAPILGYEKDVGNRTTHRVMYPESATNLQKDTSLLLIPFKTLDLEWITSALTTGTVKRTRMPVMAKINADKNKVLIYNPTFLKYVYDVWLERHGKYPSTGFSTLMFAIHVCDEVNVFGFGASKDGTWQHYWEKNKFKQTAELLFLHAFRLHGLPLEVTRGRGPQFSSRF
ncbi:CMP-N-acetylneuraminate-beta-galactosamide-alpha-2,3-sialyltransferase 1-like [Conger conger]|uniref:CMP-N-acetylneuraminate-beta-galactosamide- alpha-2,3-sialyltransferase 1-like n=1 Tax=Conger conger TaxID=82655 RepID=UPI002A5A6AAF|nr:CMP-N-acetylneuraminate-beta-galactosamide-alpha-2,3-sialyltransferase 1-like [Conger conger]